MELLKRHCFLSFLLAIPIVCGAITPKPKHTATKNETPIVAFSQDSVRLADYYYNIQHYEKAIALYKKGLVLNKKEGSIFLKKLALSEAALGNASKASAHLEDYIIKEYDIDFLNHEGFDGIRTSTPFTAIRDKYGPKLNFWFFIYVFIAIIGFYTVFLLNSNKKIKLFARLLISGFVFIHSIFILHIALIITNLQFQLPHSYRLSTGFSFLYGPFLYLYFKKVVRKHSFNFQDLKHLIPTLFFLVFLIPEYSKNANEKLDLMLAGLNVQYSNQLILIVSLKLASLIIYGYFIRKLYLQYSKNAPIDNPSLAWQRNLYQIHFLYIIAYAAYGVLVSNSILSGFLFHLQLGSMALMVLYVGHSANLQPQVFNGFRSYTNRLFPKYQKSGLTQSFSIELKDHLEYLFKNEKIYKENDISLEMVAEKLNTSRHNASQVINEHFKVSFHELVNMYRIEEAKTMLLNDQQRNLNIIDIAYEVGYNNKVTFNKAFKKDTQLTPSQFQQKVI